MTGIKHIFTRYQFELIFCFALFLLCFVVFFINTETVFADHNPAHTQLSPSNSVKASSGWFEWFGIDDKIKQLVFGLATTIGMAVVFIGGMLLDTAIHYGILTMGEVLGSKKALGIGVLQMWAVIRDVLNILFIFGLIYVGISTILDSHKSETQRTLGYLIVAALFVNFSLYVTQVVIDFTNILAIQVYNQIIGAGSLGEVFATGERALSTNSIAGAFLNMAGVTSFWEGDTAILDKLTFGAAIFYSIFMMVFLIVTGIVFALGAVLLITRFAVLIIYMIFSPLMFAGWIFPALGSKAEEYWSWGGLLKQALFAPAFLFMLYLSLFVLGRLKSIILPQPGQFSDMLASGTAAVDSFSMIMFFAVMLVFLFASIKIATSMGVVGAKGAQSIMESAKKRMMVTAGGATVGLGARVGRAVIGRRAHEAAESDSMKEWASRSMFGKAALGLARYGGNASFDARKVGGIGKTIGIGEGAKGGYKTIQDDIKKKEEEYAKSLGEVEDEDPKVAEFMAEKEALKKQLKDAKRDKAAAAEGADKQVEQEKIDKIEEEIKHQDEIIKQEKARRQIGSYVDAATEASTRERYAVAEEKKTAAKTAISKTSVELKKAQKQLTEAQRKLKETETLLKDTSLTPERKGELEKELKDDTTSLASFEAQVNAETKKFTEAANALKEQNDTIKKLKHEAKKNTGNLGYAGSLEQTNWVKSAVFGRTVSQDKAAGKAVRKKFSKGHAKDEAHKHEEKAPKKEKAGDDHAPKAAPGADADH